MWNEPEGHPKVPGAGVILLIIIGGSALFVTATARTAS